MYHNNVKINFIQGSVFETERYQLDAVIVFIPCGLTFIRHDCYSFVRQFGAPIEQFREFFLYENKLKEEIGNHLRYILIDRNKNHKIYHAHDMYHMIEYTLSKMLTLGAKRIGMNGIRTHGPKPELNLYHEVNRWVNYNRNNFEEIYLIDKTGGFNGLLTQ